MITDKWMIYWNEYSADTYTYGSEITYHSRDDVEYQNNLLPPGTVVKQWYSKTNYQGQRFEPSLPMIDGESQYRILVNIDCPKRQHCIMRLVFYDRYENEAGYIDVREESRDFRCPLKTYSYRLQLISGGVTHFHFHSVMIQEIVDEAKQTNQKT